MRKETSIIALVAVGVVVFVVGRLTHGPTPRPPAAQAAPSDMPWRQASPVPGTAHGADRTACQEFKYVITHVDGTTYESSGMACSLQGVTGNAWCLGIHNGDPCVFVPAAASAPVAPGP